MIQPEIIRELAAYADGEVDDRLRADLERAVAGDPECRAAVARWKALRLCAQRALASEPVPGDLQERIRQRLAYQRRVSVFRWWGFSGLALASAALIVLVALKPSPPAAAVSPAVATATVVVYPGEFAEIYRRCGYARHHTLTDVTGRGLAEVAAEVRAWDKTDFPVYLPNMTGYRLAGVCPCFPRPVVRTVHANYVRGQFNPDESSPPEQVVSFFSLSDRVDLAEQRSIVGQGRQYLHPQRNYCVAQAGENVTVIKWDEAETSLAVCSCIPQEELVRLVDSTELATLPEPAPQVAGLSSQTSAPVRGGYAAAVLACGFIALVLRGRLSA
jgi:hypothetical protein